MKTQMCNTHIHVRRYIKICNNTKLFHWLGVPQCIQCKFGVTVHRFLQVNAPQYLVDCWKSSTDAASRQRLRSASCHQLIVPLHRRIKLGRRAFLLQVRQPGTRCQTISVIRRWAKTLLDDHKRHICLRCIKHVAAIDHTGVPPTF